MLIDVNVPPQESDRQLFEYLRSMERPFAVVATKADKLSGNTLRKALDGFQKTAPDLRVVPYSARTGSGRDELWQEFGSNQAVARTRVAKGAKRHCRLNRNFGLC